MFTNLNVKYYQGSTLLSSSPLTNATETIVSLKTINGSRLQSQRYVTKLKFINRLTIIICDPPKDCSHFGDDTCTTNSNSKTNVLVRRPLYLSLIKSQLCYATKVWSPAYVTLNAKVEQVQRRASRWILRTRKDESSDKERLILLDLLPLSLDRELKDLIFFINAFTVVPI